MAPLKIGTTKVKSKKTAKPQPVQPTQPGKLLLPGTGDGIRPFIPLSEGLEHMMGFDVDDSSDLSNDVSNPSQPNFSFIPSHKHSSPHNTKRKTIPTVHRLASMSTVPNSDLAQPDTTDSAQPDTSYESSSSARNINSNIAPMVANPPPAPTTNKIVESKKQNRKQRTPSKLKIFKEIAYLQHTVNTLIPKLSFGRVIREILADYSNSDLRVTVDMLQCLQEAAEIYIVQLFEDSYRCTVHRGRLTLIPKDMQLALMIRKQS